MIENIRLFEPARLRGFVTAALLLLGSFGITLNADFNAWVDVAINVLAAGLPVVQAELTRRKVTPTVRAEELAELALAAEYPLEDFEVVDPNRATDL